MKVRNSHTLAANVENLNLVSWAANGTGNAENNAITGNDNTNKLTCGGQRHARRWQQQRHSARRRWHRQPDRRRRNDDLDGGVGADKMLGGLDDDTYTVNEVGDLVTEGLNQGFDTVRTDLAYTLGANLEGLVLTGSGRRRRRRQHAA